MLNRENENDNGWSSILDADASVPMADTALYWAEQNPSVSTAMTAIMAGFEDNMT